MAAWHRFIKGVFTSYSSVITSILMQMLTWIDYTNKCLHKQECIHGHPWSCWKTALADFPLYQLIYMYMNLWLHVRTLYRQSSLSAKRTSSLKISTHSHTILFVLLISFYHSWQVWCPFTHWLRGEKMLTWTLVPWILCQRWESADTANCLRKKSQQRSEIKCRQLLLCFLELLPSFNISYLLLYLLWLFIDISGQFLERGSRHQGCRQHNKMSFHRLWFCPWLCSLANNSLIVL